MSKLLNKKAIALITNETRSTTPNEIDTWIVERLAEREVTA